MMLGTYFNGLPIIYRIVFWTGLAGIVAGMAGGRLAAEVGWTRCFDNLHWTFGTAAAAVLAWLGWRAARREGRSAGPQGWFAVGFIGYALGQLVWDIQSALAYQDFPAPSDLFYLWLGPALVLGLAQEVRASTRRIERQVILLDSLALSIASLTLVLALYLPQRGTLNGISLAVLVAYPVTLLMVTLFLLILIPALRLRATASLMLFLPGIAVTAWSWMRWNLMALQGAAIDGDVFNASFSVAILLTGLGVANWRLESSDSPRWDRLCEGFLRLLPLLTVILASGAIIATNFHPGIPDVVRHLTLSGAFAVIALAVIRQSALLKERDKLLAAREALREREAQLDQERGFLKSLLATIPDLVWMKDPQGVYLLCNSMFERFFGAKEPEIVGKTDFDFVAPELAECFRRNDLLATEAGKPSVNEEWLTFADGGYRGLFETVKTPMRDGDGRLLGVLGVARDITERMQAENRLRAITAELEATLRAIPDLLFELDEEGRYINLWTQDESLLAAEKKRVLGHLVSELLPSEAAQEVMAALQEAAAKGYSRGQQILLQHPQELHWFELSTARKQVADGPANFILLSRDITALKRHEEALERIALYDALTGIPNRRMLVDRMGQAIAQARREGRLLAICYLDLDGFKPVNDTLGHEAGDQMLIEIAERITRCIRSGDTVARLGGDEFVVLLVGITDPTECTAGLDRLLEAINQPVLLEGCSISLGASIGVTLFPADDEDPDTLLRHADQAMYSAKASGKGQYRFYPSCANGVGVAKVDCLPQQTHPTWRSP